jgi:transcriptional regulator with XRE-family HTH domain
MSMNRKNDPKFTRAYVRGMLRSAFVSLFWAIISERKKRIGLTLQEVAKLVGVNKAELSRWFKGDPNWTINTIASLAHALNVELQIKAVDIKTGEVYTPAGLLMGASDSTRTEPFAQLIPRGGLGVPPETSGSEPPVFVKAAA